MALGEIAISDPEGFLASRRRRHDLLELAAGYVLILVVIWTPRPWQKLSYFVAASYLISTFWISRPGWKSMGLWPTNFARSLWLIPVALLASAAAALVAARVQTLHTPGGPLMFVERFSGYALGACVQQLLLQDFFLPRLLRLMRTPVSAVVVAATIFSLAHLPNPILTGITFVWGLAACLFFLRYRNLYTLIIAHTILGIAVAITIPRPVIHNMRVGIGYMTYSPHHVHQRSH